jgi:hypothetical protein
LPSERIAPFFVDHQTYKIIHCILHCGDSENEY